MLFRSDPEDDEELPWHVPWTGGFTTGCAEDATDCRIVEVGPALDDDCDYWEDCDDEPGPMNGCEYSDDCYDDPDIYVREDPWYVEAFPGIGRMVQYMIPGQQPSPHIVYTPTPAPPRPPPPPPPPPPQQQQQISPQPSCWISAMPTEVVYDGTATLQWNSFNTTHAVLTNFGDVRTEYKEQVRNIRTDRTYTLNVSGPGGQNRCYTRITVKLPAKPASCIISAYPDSIKKGDSANLAWRSENAVRATLSGIGSVNIRGGVYVKPQKTTPYTLTVYNSENRPTVCKTQVKVR